jgi:hypothetical protein
LLEHFAFCLRAAVGPPTIKFYAHSAHFFRSYRRHTRAVSTPAVLVGLCDAETAVQATSMPSPPALARCQHTVVAKARAEL